MRFDNPNVITLGTGGDNLTFDNGTSPAIVGVNSGSHVIAENIFLASDLIAGPASGTTLTVSGNTSGIKALHLSGAGTLVLAGTNNTHSGGTVINSGTLKLSGTATPGAVGSAVSVSSGGLLDLNGTNQTIRFTAGTGVGTVVNNSGSGTSILTLDGTATINGGLVTVADNTNGSAGKVAVVIAKNTQPMSNANTYSGGTTVNAGAFLYLNFNSPNGAGAGPINLLALGANGAASSGLVVDGATYANDITGAGYVHNNSSAAATVVTTILTGNLNTSGPFIFRAGTGIVYNFAGNGTTSVLSGVIGSTTSMVNGAVATGSIIKSGTGSLTLSGSSIYTGNTTVSGGTLTFAGSGKIYNGGTNSATVSIATGAQVVASGITNNVLGFAATATWNISGTFNSSGGGAQTLPANVILNNGTLSGVANGTFGTFLGNSAYTVTITANGTSNAINAANFGMGTGNGIALNTPLEADALSISTPLGLTAQAGSLTKAGLGTVTLSGANNYTGTTTITGGTLVITGATQATSAITFSGGRLGLDVSSTVAAASASVNFTDQQVLVSGTPTLASYTLLTTSSMTGTPTLAAPAPAGYELKVESNSLKLVKKAGYATWAATNAPTTGNTPSADEDSDGVSNGVEYVLGGTIATKDLDKLPGISTTPGGDMVFTFKRDQKSIDGSTTAIIELGTTLGAWPDAYPVPDGPVAANPGLTVTQGSPVGFDTVTLVLPRGLDAAKFARLKVTATP
jgi:autotransporter-associated beta strand protein